MSFKYFILILFISLKSFSIILDPIEMNLSDPDQRATNIAVAKIQGALRDQMSSAVIIQNAKRGISQTLQNELTHLPVGLYAATASTFVNSNNDWEKNFDLPMSKCLVMMGVNGLLSSGITRQSILMHEAFHCFQFQMAGSMNSALDRPQWVLEGSAMFVGEDLIAETSPIGVSYFKKYTRDVINLFDRNYDAYPFFLHLKLEGANVYQVFHQFFAGGSDNLKLWQDIVSSVPHRALATWAASFAYRPDWGIDWDLKTRDYYPRATTALEPSPITPFPKTRVLTGSLPLSAPGVIGLPRHDEVELETDQFVRLSVENGAALIFYRTAEHPEGQTHFIDENQFIQFCYGPNCDCPETIGAVHTIKVNDPIVFMASVSLRQNHTVHFTEGTKTCCSNEGGFDSRMVGTWESPGTRYLEIWGNYPYTGGIKENTGSGTIEIIIGRHGEIIKKYKDLNFFSRVTKGNKVSTIDFRMKYEVSGCMTTRSINETQGWLYINDMLDRVQWTTVTQTGASGPAVFKQAHGEWYQSSLCAGNGTTENPCTGTYFFEGDLLRFNGGVGNSVYNDLIRVR